MAAAWVSFTGCLGNRIEVMTVDPKMLESIGFAEPESNPSKDAGEAVSQLTGVHYIPELEAVIDMDKFQAQMAIPQLERAVIALLKARQ